MDLLDVLTFDGGGQSESSRSSPTTATEPSGFASPTSCVDAESHEPDNPFGCNGIFARFGEQIPIVNTGLQCIHELVGDEVALRRARRGNPIGRDGYITQAVENIPLFNYVVQEYFRNIGDDRALARARESDPLSSNGYVTKVMEHIPGVSDVALAWHSYKGEEHAAERARARSLQKLLSKDGVLTRLVELVPLTNLIPAFIHEVNGDREAAMRALNIVEGWSQAFDPDSAFAKVAELMPGVDVVAFALHVQGGYYAQALRSLTKTSWVDISAEKAYFTFSCRTFQDMSCSTVEVEGVTIEPRQLSLVVGMKDVLTNFLILDKEGQRRVLRADIDLERIGKANGALSLTRELLEYMINDQIKRVSDRSIRDIPDNLQWMADTLNRLIPIWRIDGVFTRMSFPAWRNPLPEAPPELQRAFQLSAPRSRFSRGLLQDVGPVRLRSDDHVRSAAASASAVGCFSFSAAMLTVKASPLLCALGCLGGCFAVAAELGRAGVRRIARQLDEWNAECWADVVKLPQPQTQKYPGGSCRPEGQNKFGLKIELHEADSKLLGFLMRRYFFENVWGDCFRARFMKAIEPLIRMLAGTVLETEACTVPVVMEVELEEWEIELEGYTFDLWMPSMRLAITLVLSLDGGIPLTQRVFATLPDSLLHCIAEGLEKQMSKWDLRELDSRFAGFRQPAQVSCQVRVNWRNSEAIRFEMHNFCFRLELPD